MRALIYIFLLAGLPLWGQTIMPIFHTTSGCVGDANNLWNFNSDATDDKGNNDLTKVGTVTYESTLTPVPEGTTYAQVNASGRYFTGGSIDFGAKFSIGFELYHGTGTSKGICRFFDGSNDGFDIYLDVTNDDVYIRTWGSGGGNTNATALNASIPTNTWYSLIFVFDKAAGTCDTYINGVDKTTSSTTETDYPVSFTDFTIASWDAGQYLYGYMDAGFVYKYNLAQTQIDDIVTTPGEEQCE